MVSRAQRHTGLPSGRIANALLDGPPPVQLPRAAAQVCRASLRVDGSRRRSWGVDPNRADPDGAPQPSGSYGGAYRCTPGRHAARVPAVRQPASGGFRNGSGRACSAIVSPPAPRLGARTRSSSWASSVRASRAEGVDCPPFRPRRWCVRPPSARRAPAPARGPSPRPGPPSVASRPRPYASRRPLRHAG